MATAFNKIIRSFKKDGNKIVEQTKVTPTNIETSAEIANRIANISPVELNKKVEALQKEIDAKKERIKSIDAENEKLSKAIEAKKQGNISPSKFNDLIKQTEIEREKWLKDKEQNAGNAQGSIPLDKNGLPDFSKQIVIGAETDNVPIPAGAITYNMVRLGYRIQYSPKMTVLLDNKNGVRQIVVDKYTIPFEPISKQQFMDLINNRATVAEIEKLYDCARVDSNVYVKYYNYNEAGEQNIW